MRERPIPFSAPMVRAVLAGTKTQTRRVVKPQPFQEDRDICRPSTGWAVVDRQGAIQRWDPGHIRQSCPYGQPGDRLWVREAWRADRAFDAVPPRSIPVGSPTFMEASRDSWLGGPHDGQPGALRPGMFMPRWASRITLEVTGVRVERLQGISEADAQAEGAPSADLASGRECIFPHQGTHRWGFQLLWESINGPGSWAANPWVWVVEFRRA